jgi:protein SCO1/2
MRRAAAVLALLALPAVSHMVDGDATGAGQAQAIGTEGRESAAGAEAQAPAAAPGAGSTAGQTEPRAAPPALPFPAGISARFRLTDQTGREVTEADFAGRPMAIFFGYAGCEAICSVAPGPRARSMRMAASSTWSGRTAAC